MNIETLKKRKKELGLTNQQLAQISGVSLGTINKVFSGATRSPQLDTITALTSALGLDSYEYFPNAHAERLCTSPASPADDSSDSLSHNMIRDAGLAYQPRRKNGPYTLTDYYALPEDVRAELIDGYLIYMEAPSVQHQEIIGELHYYIRHYIKTNKGTCRVILSPIDVRLDNDDRTILEPDLIILCDPTKNDGRRINGAPDLVMEVVSPSSRAKDYLVKLNKYWAAGVREYWIIDPEQRSVSTYLFHAKDEDFKVHNYTFDDKIPVGIYENFVIDFGEFEL